MQAIKTALIIATLALSAQVFSQTTIEELKAHPEYTASNYLVYPAPEKNAKYTKAPTGYKPFYISHYGRHGSRYHYSKDDYTYLLETLAKADSAKALSVTGQYVMLSVNHLVNIASNRTGDLTQKGVTQHEGIATRMAKNFPDVFKSRNAKISETNAKGKTVQKSVKLPPQIDAYASTSGRCIVSMGAFIGSLKAQVPSAQIRMESSKSLMHFINNFDFGTSRNYAETEAYKAESDKLWNNISTKSFIQTIFADSSYVAKNIDASKFYNTMFEIASNIQNLEEDDDLIIFDRIFSKEEKIARWKAQNAWWYSILGTCPLTGNDGISSAKPILKHILEEAEKAIRIQGDSSMIPQNIVATLRFGHDTGILPLAGLMQLSIANAKVSDLSKLHEYWTDFRIIPMAANLQIAFYRDSRNSKPILVKFLYNEREVTAPIPCNLEKSNDSSSKKATGKKEKCPTAPYYRWEDAQKFFQGQLENF